MEWQTTVALIVIMFQDIGGGMHTYTSLFHMLSILQMLLCGVGVLIVIFVCNKTEMAEENMFLAIDLWSLLEYTLFLCQILESPPNYAFLRCPFRRHRHRI